MRTNPSSPSILAASIAALLAVTPAFAATWTWDGGSGNNNWTNGVNWNPDVSPDNDGTADIIFGGTTRLTPDLTQLWAVNSVTFNNTAGAFNLVSTAGNILIITAGGITNNDTDAQTISHAITLFAPQTWTAAAGGLTIFGAVQNNGYLLTIDAAAGVVIQGGLSGSGGLTKNGLGDLILAGPANTHTGTTTVNAGSLNLQVGGSGITAIPGALVIGDGVGTAIDSVIQGVSERIADSATVSVFSTGAWSLNGTTPETITNLNIVSTGIAGGGLVTLGNGAVNLLGNLTMTGGTVTASGTGALQLIGNLTTNASGVAASISSKFALFNGAHTFTIADGAALIDLDVSGQISETGLVGPIIKNGLGTLRLSAANVYTGGTTLNAGTILIGHDSALGTGPLTGNGGTLRADGAARMIANALNGSFAVDGAFDLALNTPLNLNGDITKNGTGALIFAQAGTFERLTLNAGTVRFDAAVTFSGGLTNSATLLFGTQTPTPTVNGTGLNNQGSLTLAGATLVGSGPVVNSGLLSGNGTIGGTGGFTNNVQLTVSGGNLTLAKAGANANAGNFTVTSGLQLRLTGGTLANTGTIDLAGSIVAGTATLSNNAGGTVSGRGLISAPFANAGGTLRAFGGTMNLTNAFTSSGVIRLDDAAGLAGGAITNTGRIEGDGTISSAVTNSATGKIRVDAGETLTFIGTFAPNAGQLNLQGGALDFASPFINSAAGFIAGRGVLYTAGLTNHGVMAFSGGTADLFGDVSLTAGARAVTSGAGSVTTFWDDVTHNGTEIFTGVNCSTVFFGAQSGAGPFTGTGTVYFIGDLQPGNSSASVSFGGDVVLGFFARTVMEIGGTAPGSQHDKLSVADTLDLAGDLEVQLINGFVPSPGQSFDLLDTATLTGGFTVVSLPSLPAGGFWRTDTLNSNGVLAVGVTPATFAEFAAAYGLLGGPGGDDDGDGVTNALEFLLGSHPLDGASVPSQEFTHDGQQSVYELVMPELTGTTSSYIIESSENLATWATLATKTGPAPWTGGVAISNLLNGYVSVTLEEADAAPKRFYRLRAALE